MAVWSWIEDESKGDEDSGNECWKAGTADEDPSLFERHMWERESAQELLGGDRVRRPGRLGGRSPWLLGWPGRVGPVVLSWDMLLF